MNLEPIAVLGGGHGAHAMAADLALAGCDVRLCEHPALAERFKATLGAKAIELTGIGRTGTARPAMVTTDFALALRGARLVNLCIPAFAHELFFERMIPYLSSDHTVVVWAGDFGSLRLAHLMSRRGDGPHPAILEGSTLPYGARLTGPARVDILLFAKQILVAGLPATETREWPTAFKRLWPGVTPAEHVLQAAFANPNPIVHPPGALLSVGRIEYSKGDFYMYREGMGPATRRVIRGLFEDSLAVARKLGFTIPGFRESDFDKPASVMGEVFECPGDRYKAIADIKGPSTLRDRYLTEDLPCGLLPISQLGKKVAVPTPTIDAIIQLGSFVCEDDFWRGGRNLKSLGIDLMTPEEIMAYVLGGPVAAPKRKSKPRRQHRGRLPRTRR